MRFDLDAIVEDAECRRDGTVVDLVADYRRLQDAIRAHRDLWDTTVGRWDPRRDDANEALWRLVEGDGDV